MLFAASLLLLVTAASAQLCNQACQMNYVPLCGTDGRTYGNKCQLDAHNCLMRASVGVQYAGECTAACKVACTRDFRPVCGTDGITYGNKCQLQSLACTKKSGVAMAHEGECVHAQLVPMGEEPDRACKVACQRNYEPVCGSDGITYPNACQLNSFACLKKLKVLVSHLGKC